MDNQSLSHTRWKCQYHVVFIPKYRRKVMYGKVKQDVREIIKTLCEYKKVKITAGAVCVDHVVAAQSLRSRSVRLPAKNRPECADAAADGLRMVVPAWGGDRGLHSIRVSGAVLSMERD